MQWGPSEIRPLDRFHFAERPLDHCWRPLNLSDVNERPLVTPGVR